MSDALTVIPFTSAERRNPTAPDMFVILPTPRGGPTPMRIDVHFTTDTPGCTVAVRGTATKS